MTPEQLSAAIRAALQSAVDAGDLSRHRARGGPGRASAQPRPRGLVDQHRPPAGQGRRHPAARPGRRAGEPPRRRARASRPSTSPGPGFLNITLEAASAGELARSIVEAGATYGHSTAEAGRVVNLEFISANPTGPIHIGHTRWAALGDAMRRLLTAAGAQVAAEYYINDAGAQMDKFGASVLARAAGQEPPEDGYPGDYVADRAAEVLAQRPDLLELDPDEALRGRPRPRLHRPARRHPAHPRRVRGALRRLVLRAQPARGAAPSSRPSPGCASRATSSTPRARCGCARPTSATTRTASSSAADGSPTYFAADAAYYLSKKDRGFDEKVYLLGADHHGYINRLKAIAACAGDDPEHNIEVQDRPARSPSRASGWASGWATPSTSTS